MEWLTVRVSSSRPMRMQRSTEGGFDSPDDIMFSPVGHCHQVLQVMGCANKFKGGLVMSSDVILGISDAPCIVNETGQSLTKGRSRPKSV